METNQKTQMTSAERMRALFSGKGPDRVPFNPFAAGFCAKVVGFEVSDIYSNPKKSFDAQLWAKEMFGHDANPFYGYAFQGGWELGGEIKFPTGKFEQAPVVSRFPIKTPEDIERIEVRDVSKAGAVPLMMEFAKIQRDHGLGISVHCGTPFKISSNSMEMEMMARLMIKEPILVHKLLRKATEFCISLISYWIDTFGPGRIICVDGAPTESNDLISPKHFERFGLPYVIEVHEKALRMGIKLFSTHICGDQNLNLNYWQEVPMGEPGIMTFGHEVDLNKAKEIFGGKCIIGGNVDPKTIQFGTGREVYNLCKEAIEKGKDSPRGYILMPGCELPPEAPPYNVYMMKKAVEDFGYY